MYLRDRSNLTPSFAGSDARLADYVVRGHLSMKGLDNVRRFYGLLVQSDLAPDEFVLVLRGTRSPADYVANGLFGLVRFSGGQPGAGRVHRGWHDLFKSARLAGPESFSPQPAAKADLVRDVNALIATCQARARPDGRSDASAVKLTLTAHSLGAAILTMFVVKNGSVEGTIKPASVYTLASPMVGDAAFVARFNALCLDSQRIVVDRDTVPLLPGRRWGYRHVERELRLRAASPASPRRTHDIRTYRELLGPANER